MGGDVVAGRYLLEERLGAGGMSEVWRALDQELERTVAVKLLRPDADRDRFAREARAVAAVGHPNINQLFDYGEADGRPFMVLEYLAGGSLEELLPYGEPLPDARTEQIASDVAAGLAHAHERGLVHRDLKPANILFDGEGRAKIADFGIARLGGAGTLTEAGTVLGTAAYISPEQAAGQAATPASDVYSFGVILFRMLTGRLPFEAEDPLALVTMHQTQLAPPLREFRDDAPARLESLVAAALAKDPADRPPDGAAVLGELAPAAATMPLAAAAAADGATMVLAPTDATVVHAPADRPPPLPPRRRFPLALLAALLLLLAAGGAAIAYALTRPSSGSPRTPSQSAPPLSLPKVTKSRSTATATTAQATTVASTAPTTTRATTTRATTRQQTHTTPPPPTTTAQATTTTAPPPTTTAPPPTTAPPGQAKRTTATTQPGPGG